MIQYRGSESYDQMGLSLMRQSILSKVLLMITTIFLILKIKMRFYHLHNLFQPAQPAAPASPTYSNQPAQSVSEQPYSDEEYQLALENNPVIKEYAAKGNSIADLEYAISTGDISGLVDQFGQPFSLKINRPPYQS